MKRLFLLPILLFFAATLMGNAFHGAQPVYAANADDFKPGRIIDDAVFTDSSTMAPNQIQTFLKQKLNSVSGGCDVEGNEFHNGVRRKNYSSSNPAPFTCLIYYYENPSTKENNYGKFVKNADGSYKKTSSGDYVPVVKTGMKSAAQIIYDVSQKHQINPQVLIVLLQKEQSLVGDDWPWKIQYRSATGYGCPDTAACDSEYYGFYNQVNNAANMFRKIMNQDSGWTNWYPPGNANILYHPNSSCGYSQVNIQNLATSALYNYTPYQPNQAALNNLYGSGDGCSAYGNRNFWRDFYDWFGSTHLTTTIKIEGDENPARVYLVWRGHYYHIASREVLEALNLDGQSPKTVSQNSLDSLTQGPRLNYLVKFDDDTRPVYLLDNRKIYHFNGLTVNGTVFASGRDVFEAYGYGDPGETIIYPASLKSFFLGGGEMALILRAHNSGRAYYVENSSRRWIINREAYDTLGNPTYSSQPDVRLSLSLVKNIPNGAPIMLNNTLLKASDANKYYLYDQSLLYDVSSSVFSAWSIDPDYSSLRKGLIELLPSSGATLGYTLKVDSNHYIAESGKFHPINSTTRSSWGLSDSLFQNVTEAFKSRFKTGTAVTNLVRINGDAAVYMVKNGSYHRFTSREAFDTYGYQMSDVVSTQYAGSKLLSPSSNIYAPGELIQQTDKKPVYLVTGELKRSHISSRYVFENYGFTFDQVMNVNSMENYSDVDPITNLVTYEGKYWLIDKGVKRLVKSDLLSADKYNWSSKATTPLINKIYNLLNRHSDLTIYIRGTSDPTPVYRVENGSKRQYSSREAFDNDSGNWNDIQWVSDYVLSSLPDGDPI